MPGSGIWSPRSPRAAPCWPPGWARLVPLATSAAWRADMLAGKTTLMAAATGTDVSALSAQARAERVEAGQVEPGCVPLRDGTLAGCGGWVVTRENNRTLAVYGGRDWVKNGDAWQVVARHESGALRVQHLAHRGCVTLPAWYAARSAAMLAATTQPQLTIHVLDGRFCSPMAVFTRTWSSTMACSRCSTSVNWGDGRRAPAGDRRRCSSPRSPAAAAWPATRRYWPARRPADGSLF